MSFHDLAHRKQRAVPPNPPEGRASRRALAPARSVVGSAERSHATATPRAVQRAGHARGPGHRRSGGSASEGQRAGAKHGGATERDLGCSWRGDQQHRHAHDRRAADHESRGREVGLPARVVRQLVAAIVRAGGEARHASSASDHVPAACRPKMVPAARLTTPAPARPKTPNCRALSVEGRRGWPADAPAAPVARRRGASVARSSARCNGSLAPAAKRLSITRFLPSACVITNRWLPGSRRTSKRGAGGASPGPRAREPLASSGGAPRREITSSGPPSTAIESSGSRVTTAYATCGSISRTNVAIAARRSAVSSRPPREEPERPRRAADGPLAVAEVVGRLRVRSERRRLLERRERVAPAALGSQRGAAPERLASRRDLPLAVERSVGALRLLRLRRAGRQRLERAERSSVEP